MNVFEALRSNRSVRKFTNQPVDREQIERIMDAGRVSGSAKNTQPWTWVVVTEPDTLLKLSECGPWCGHLAGAAFAVVMVVDTLTEPPTFTKPFDLGRSSQNMILAAWALGVASCMATIYEPERARAALGIPDEMMIPWAISFGYPDPTVDPRNRPARKEGRRSLDEVVRWERWE